MEKDFNNLKIWLPPKIDAKGLSPEEFSRLIGTSRTTVYNWLIDRCRPTEQSMAKACEVLGVPLAEGLRQYTPRRNGRPPELVSRQE